MHFIYIYLVLGLLFGCTENAVKNSNQEATIISVGEGKAQTTQSPLVTPTESIKSTVADALCQLDLSGLVESTDLSSRLKDQRRRAWGRERHLVLPKSMSSMGISERMFTESKLVSVEVMSNARNGQHVADFHCVKWRQLSEANVSSLQSRLRDEYGLKETEKGIFQRRDANEFLQVHVGMDERGVSQIDFALSLNQASIKQPPYLTRSPTISWLESLSNIGFEFGVYISGRAGIKYPGLERSLLVVRTSQTTALAAANELGFKQDKSDERVLKMDGQSLTTRVLAPQETLVSWQRRLSPSEMREISR